ncbi:MAG: ABC transporter ATP-binding protein [Candidatus Bathyarchaeia archaeon]
MLLLRISNLNVYYGDLQALFDLSLEVNEGEIVSIVGSNGAGKTTTLKTISGLIQPRSGMIEFMGERIDGLPPHQIVENGISQIPEGRRIFPYMSALENLLLGAFTRRAREKRLETLKWVYGIFPVLKEREGQLAGTLSGGEQQMLAIGRGLMSRPKLLMLDEPSLGLAPMIVRKIFEIIEQLKKEGITILLVEQNVQRALTLADRGYVLESGRIELKGEGKELLQNPHIKKAYLGL